MIVMIQFDVHEFLKLLLPDTTMASFGPQVSNPILLPGGIKNNCWENEDLFCTAQILVSSMATANNKIENMDR